MIVGLQAAVLCDRFEVDAQGRINYLDILGGALVVDTRPQLVLCCLCLHLVTDRAACWGQAAVRVPNFETTIPFRVAADTDVAGVLLPLAIPVLREGALLVEIKNTDPAGDRQFQAEFRLVIAEDAVDSIRSEPQVLREAEIAAHVAREALEGKWLG